ncbi:MAG: hypothetical protein WA655_20610 [Candidatus Korobacteraceae bacterium]
MNRRIVGFGCTVLVLFAIGAVFFLISSSVRWLILAPLFLVLFMLVAPLLPFLRRNTTPQQLADELEKHMLGTEGGRDWDNVTSGGIRDQRLDTLRGKLWKFDSLAVEEHRKEFEEIIAALRRGEIPDVKPD